LTHQRGPSDMPTSTIHPRVECAQCGEQASNTVPVDGRDFCEECAADCFVCDRCDARTEEVYDAASGDVVCVDCAAHYVRCDRCERLAESVRVIADGDEVCEPCVRFHYWSCDGCGELIDTGDYCGSCEDDDPDTDTDVPLHDYSYKPLPVFHGTGPLRGPSGKKLP
jgi:hypothetical protein